MASTSLEDMKKASNTIRSRTCCKCNLATGSATDLYQHFKSVHSEGAQGGIQKQALVTYSLFHVLRRHYTSQSDAYFTVFINAVRSVITGASPSDCELFRNRYSVS